MDEPNDHFAIRLEADGAYVRLILSGDIDLVVRDDLRHAIARAVNTSVRHVVIDLDQVTFLDCSGLGALVMGRNAALRAGCVFEVVNARGVAHRVLELTGVLAELSGVGALAS